MRTLFVAAVLFAALVIPGFVAETASATDGGDCGIDDVSCTVQDTWCDVYEKLPPFIPYVCR